MLGSARWSDGPRAKTTAAHDTTGTVAREQCCRGCGRAAAGRSCMVPPQEPPPPWPPKPVPPLPQTASPLTAPSRHPCLLPTPPQSPPLPTRLPPPHPTPLLTHSHPHAMHWPPLHAHLRLYPIPRLRQQRLHVIHGGLAVLPVRAAHAGQQSAADGAADVLTGEELVGVETAAAAGRAGSAAGAALGTCGVVCRAEECRASRVQGSEQCQASH